MALPMFGFDGQVGAISQPVDHDLGLHQVAFAVVACWTDTLFTYPMGALEFVGTIAGCLLAAGMSQSESSVLVTSLNHDSIYIASLMVMSSQY